MKLFDPDMTHLERDVLVSRIKKDPSKIYIITHGTDTIIETAKYISKKLHSGTILLIGAKLPEVFKDTDADFNLGFAIGAAKGELLLFPHLCVYVWIKTKDHVRK